jgi:hypothetical protein
MNRDLQELVWSKLPLNEFQRQDMLNNIIQDLEIDKYTEQINSELEVMPLKKRKKGEISEQSESSNHMC